MPVLVVLTFIVQLAVAVHVVRTGRETFWIWLIIGVPVLGALIYILTQVVPDLGRSHSMQRAATKAGKFFDPGADLRQARDELARADTTANRVGLGDAMMASGQANQALEMYRSALVPPADTDPDIMAKAAAAAFELDGFAECRKLLDDLRAANPDYASPEAHLLYARALEGLEDLPAALEEFEALESYYPGEEAAVRYARLLVRTGSTERARSLLKTRLESAKLAPKFYRKQMHDWLFEANRILAETADR